MKFSDFPVRLIDVSQFNDDPETDYKPDLAKIAAEGFIGAGIRVGYGIVEDRLFTHFWAEAGVTWNKYNGTNAWGTAGADNTTSDRESSAIGTLSVGASPTLNTGMDITLTVSKIQEMVSCTFTNNGFVIRVNTESADDIQWATSDHATAGYRPKLVIEYSLPSGVAVASLSDYGII